MSLKNEFKEGWDDEDIENVSFKEFTIRNRISEQELIKTALEEGLINPDGSATLYKKSLLMIRAGYN